MKFGTIDDTFCYIMSVSIKPKESVMPHNMTIFPKESFMDLSLYQYGYAECEPLHAFGPAIRNHYLFHYIISGRGKLISTAGSGIDAEYYLEAGQGFLIWPQQRNTYMADERDPWTYAWIEFDGLKAMELLSQSGLSYDYPVYISRDKQEQERMKSELTAITLGNELLPVDVMGHLYHFFGALIKSSSMSKKIAGGSLREFYVRESISFIEQHYQNPAMTIEDIALSCNLSRGYLSKIFAAVLAVSPQDFLIQYRLNKACELLQITDKPIGEVSVLVGYPNQLHFSRAFRRIFGKPPSQWRSENKFR